MSLNGKYYLTFTIHAFREILFDRNGRASGCSKHHASFLNNYIKTFRSKFCLEKLHESDKEIKDKSVRHAIRQIQAETWHENSVG